MPDRDSIDILRRSIEAFNDGDYDKLGSTLAPRGRYEELATHRANTTRDEEVSQSRGWRTVFPDAHGTIRNIFASGDNVVAEITWEGTQRGALEGPDGKIEATGKRINLPASMVARVHDGVISERHHYFDMRTMVDQLRR